jgi:protein-disulfide isomerase
MSEAPKLPESQEITSENLPAAELIAPEPQATADVQAAPEKKPLWRILVAPAWFLLGILVGLGAFATYTQYTRVPPAPALTQEQVQAAARAGFVEALQQLQAAQGSGQNSQVPPPVDPNAFAVRAANQLGNPDAPITIVEYADFQCPFCSRHHQMVAGALMQEFVDTGKAKILYKHLAFLGPESVYAAIASECAADQGRFWEFHDYLFEHQGGENQGAFNKDKLIGFGRELGLDMPAFEQCVQTDATVARVQADTEEAQKFGVGSTPTFFVNGKPLVGLQSVEEFRQAIEQAANP